MTSLVYHTGCLRYGVRRVFHRFNEGASPASSCVVIFSLWLVALKLTFALHCLWTSHIKRWTWNYSRISSGFLTKSMILGYRPFCGSNLSVCLLCVLGRTWSVVDDFKNHEFCKESRRNTFRFTYPIMLGGISLGTIQLTYQLVTLNSACSMIDTVLCFNWNIYWTETWRGIHSLLMHDQQ